MPRIVALPNLVVPNGAAVSNALSRVHFDDAECLAIYPPSAFTGAGARRVEVSWDPAGSEWFLLESGGTLIAITVSQAFVITEIAFNALRIQLTDNQGADRTFHVTKQMRSL